MIRKPYLTALATLALVAGVYGVSVPANRIAAGLARVTIGA